ncbi:MAG: M56 family metallopeptidase, partial [Terriglobia bacterium]
MMLTQPLWLQDLVAFSLQAASIVIAGSLLLPLLRIHLPRIRLAYWQAVLAACVLLPLIQPWRPEWAPGERLGALSLVSMAGESSPSATWSVPTLVFAVLAGGILLRLFWTMLGLWKLRIYSKRAHPYRQETAPILEARTLIGVRPQVYLSTEIVSPATFGLLSPRVLLPHRFIELPAAQQKAIACHEFLHVARHDWTWNIAEELILAFLWFHPAVWWVVKNIRLSREQTVDAEAIRATSSRRAY